MIVWTAGIAIALFITGIIYVTSRTPVVKSKQQFHNALVSYLGDPVEITENTADSFKIKFSYENEKFIFEDYEEESFKGKYNKVFLKAELLQKITLTFSEKKKTGSVKSEILYASKIEGMAKESQVKLKLPGFLSNFEVYTNNPELINDMFLDEKVINIFSEFRNTDSRGYSFMSLKFLNGVLSLEFHSSIAFKPNIHTITSEIPLIENYLNKLLIIIKKLKELGNKP